MKLSDINAGDVLVSVDENGAGYYKALKGQPCHGGCFE